MNLPNKLTLLRVIMIPFFLIFLLLDITPYDKWIALAIFVIASLTDLADGKITVDNPFEGGVVFVIELPYQTEGMM